MFQLMRMEILLIEPTVKMHNFQHFKKPMFNLLYEERRKERKKERKEGMKNGQADQ